MLPTNAFIFESADHSRSHIFSSLSLLFFFFALSLYLCLAKPLFVHRKIFGMLLLCQIQHVVQFNDLMLCTFWQFFLYTSSCCSMLKFITSNVVNIFFSTIYNVRWKIFSLSTSLFRVCLCIFCYWLVDSFHRTGISSYSHTLSACCDCVYICVNAVIAASGAQFFFFFTYIFYLNKCSLI